MGAKVQGWMVLVLLLGTMAYAIAEEITLTTYYPSPRGVYKELRVGSGGVSSPTAKLQVTLPTTETGLAFRVDDETSDTTPFVIDQAGHVGIGTTVPAYPLESVRSGSVIPAQSGLDYAVTNAVALRNSARTLGTMLAINEQGPVRAAGLVATDSNSNRQLRLFIQNVPLAEAGLALKNVNGTFCIYNDATEKCIYLAADPQNPSQVPAPALGAYYVGPLRVAALKGDVVQLLDRDNNLVLGTGANRTVGIGGGTDSTMRLLVQGQGTSASTYAFGVRNSAATDLFAVRDDGAVIVKGMMFVDGRVVVKGNMEVDGPVVTATGSLDADIDCPDFKVMTGFRYNSVANTITIRCR